MSSRMKVVIRCRQCGERYTLRGRRDKGKVNTGFKRGLCSNDQSFDVKIEDE